MFPLYWVRNPHVPACDHCLSSFHCKILRSIWFCLFPLCSCRSCTSLIGPLPKTRSSILKSQSHRQRLGQKCINAEVLEGMRSVQCNCIRTFWIGNHHYKQDEYQLDILISRLKSSSTLLAFILASCFQGYSAAYLHQKGEYLILRKTYFTMCIQKC